MKLTFYHRVEALLNKVSGVVKFMEKVTDTLVDFETREINRNNFIVFMYAVLNYTYELMKPYNDNLKQSKKPRIEDNNSNFVYSSSTSSSGKQWDDKHYVETMKPLQYGEVDLLPNNKYAK